MAKDSGTRGEQAKEAVRKGARFTGSMLFWVLAVVILVWLAWAFFKPNDLIMGSSESVESLVTGYQEFVRPYAPPSSMSPSQDTVDEWLEYFDDDSKDFFNANVKKLSYLMQVNNREEWWDYAEGKHRMEAVRYLLKQGPLRGGALGTVRYTDADAAGTAEIFTGTTTVAVPVIKVGDDWQFDDFMGQLPALKQRLNSVTLPERRNQ